MQNSLARITSIGVVAAVLLVGSACDHLKRKSGGAAPTALNRTSTPAPIESVEIVVLESNPPQYVARVISGLPSGCAQFERAAITGRSGNTTSIAVTNTLPSDANIACTAIYGYYESNVALGSDFVSGQSYRLDLNGIVKEFKAQ